MAKRIITIGRQCGSGGHRVGEIIAGKLGIPFYDREIISLVAQRSGFCGEFVEKNGEKVPDSAVFSCAAGTFYGCPVTVPPSADPSLQVCACQTELIRELAERGPCVIVGRGADYILQERSDCLNVFFHAAMDHRIRFIAGELGISEPEAVKYIREKDKSRSRYYSRITGQEWGNTKHYHLCIDAGEFSPDLCADIVIKCLV